MYSIYLTSGNETKALASLFKSFEYDTPRAEVCCNIAQYFISKEQYTIAIFWLEQALSKTYDISSGGFFSKDYYAFIPYIELCVCHYNLGNIKLAMEYNEKAGSIKPNDSSYLNNKLFFEKLEKNPL